MIIAIYELILACAVYLMWNQESAEGSVCILGEDNQNVIQWISRRKARPMAASLLLRMLHGVLKEKSWCKFAFYIGTEKNDGSDWLSRSLGPSQDQHRLPGFEDRSEQVMRQLMEWLSVFPDWAASWRIVSPVPQPSVDGPVAIVQMSTPISVAAFIWGLRRASMPFVVYASRSVRDALRVRWEGVLVRPLASLHEHKGLVIAVGQPVERHRFPSSIRVGAGAKLVQIQPSSNSNDWDVSWVQLGCPISGGFFISGINLASWERRTPFKALRSCLSCIKDIGKEELIGGLVEAEASWIPIPTASPRPMLSGFVMGHIVIGESAAIGRGIVIKGGGRVACNVYSAKGATLESGACIPLNRVLGSFERRVPVWSPDGVIPDTMTSHAAWPGIVIRYDGELRRLSNEELRRITGAPVSSEDGTVWGQLPASMVIGVGVVLGWWKLHSRTCDPAQPGGPSYRFWILPRGKGSICVKVMHLVFGWLAVVYRMIIMTMSAGVWIWEGLAELRIVEERKEIRMMPGGVRRFTLALSVGLGSMVSVVEAGKLKAGEAARIGLPICRETFEGLREAATKAGLVDESRANYDRWWIRWTQWCRSRGRFSPFLTALEHQVEDRRREDVDLADFIIFLSQFGKYQASSHDASLAAITFQHKSMGYSDPTKNRPLLTMVRKGILRSSKGEPTKLPVSTAALKAIVKHLEVQKGMALDSGRIAEAYDYQVEKTALVVAWSFLMRKSEYLYTQAAAKKNRCLRQGDILFQKTGKGPADVAVLLKFRSSKTDVDGAGCHRTRTSTGDCIDPVRELILWKHQLLDKWKSDLEAPVFRLHSGRPLSVERIQFLVRFGMASCGELRQGKAVGSHSLRVGGATAMASAGYGVSCIMYEGRWTSTAILHYLWSSGSQANQVAKDMGNATVSLPCFGSDERSPC